MNRREFLRVGASALAVASTVRSHASAAPAGERPSVRLAVAGLGNRGTHLMRLAMGMPGVRIAALCDLNETNLNRAAELVRQAGGSAPALYGKTSDDYAAMLRRDDIDAVLIATPTKYHCPMAVAAMRAGKHVGSEVPAGFELDELWELVRTKESTGRRYMLLENYAYTRPNLQVWKMARAGIFGESYYAECGYIHDCRFMLFKPDGSLDWWGDWASRNHGSDYPTHGLGPVSKWMGINDGERLEYCTSMMTRPRVLKEYARTKFGAGSPQARIEWALGEVVATHIHTSSGRVIRLDYDVNSPRPAVNAYLLQGTKGIYDSRHGVHLETDPGEEWKPLTHYSPEHDSEYWKREGQQAESSGHGGGDYFVIRDFIHMILHDREPWIDVYDAATWSVIYHCSRQSIDRRSNSMDIPDFTNGRWKDKDWRRESLRPV